MFRVTPSHIPEWKVDREGTFRGNTTEGLGKIAEGLAKSRRAAPEFGAPVAPTVDDVEFRLEIIGFFISKS